MNHDEKNKKFDEAIGEGQDYYSSQSGKVANNTRNLVLGIIGTIWIVSYDNGRFILPNIYLILALCGCFLYLLFDLLHYFLDAKFYYKKTLSLEKNFGNWSYLIGPYNNSLIKHSKSSYNWMVTKFIAFAFVAIVFVIGMIMLFA